MSAERPPHEVVTISNPPPSYKVMGGDDQKAQRAAYAALRHLDDVAGALFGSSRGDIHPGGELSEAASTLLSTDPPCDTGCSGMLPPCP
jgi:hypothetical protein